MALVLHRSLYTFLFCLSFAAPVLVASFSENARFNHQLFTAIAGIILLCAHAVYVFCGSGRNFKKPDILDAAALGLTLILFISSLSTPQPLRSSAYLTNFFLSLYVFYAVRFVFSEEKIRTYVLWTTIFCGILIVSQGLPALLLKQLDHLDYFKQIYAGNRNFTAINLIPAICFSVFFLLSCKKRSSLLLMLVLTSALLSYVVFSRSRSVWLGACMIVLSSILLWIINLKRTPSLIPRRIMLLTLSSLIMIFAMGALSQQLSLEPASGKLSSTAESLLYPEEGSAGGRLAVWRNGVDLVKDHLVFGVGLDNWRNAYLRYENLHSVTVYERFGPFNSWLSLLGEIGLLGILTLLIFLTLNLFWRNPRTPFSCIMSAGIVCMGLAAFFHDARRSAGFLILAFMLLGFARSAEKITYSKFSKPFFYFSHLSVILLLSISSFIQIQFARETAFKSLVHDSIGLPLETNLEINGVSQILLNLKPTMTLAEILKEKQASIAELARYGNHDEGSFTYDLAQLYLAHNDSEQALSWGEKSLHERPKDALRQLLMCEAYSQSKKLELALQYCLKSFEIDPWIPDSSFKIGELYQYSYKSEQARPYFEKSKEVLHLRLAQHSNHTSKRHLTQKWEKMLESVNLRLGL